MLVLMVSILEGIMGKISKRDNISVGLLIGANCTKALEPLNTIGVIEGEYHAVVYQGKWQIQMVLEDTTFK